MKWRIGNASDTGEGASLQAGERAPERKTATSADYSRSDMQVSPPSILRVSDTSSSTTGRPASRS